MSMPPGGRQDVVVGRVYWWIARPICFRLLVHWMRRAASRADCTAGKSSAIRTAMIAITTSSSIRVKARRVEFIGLVLRYRSHWPSATPRLVCSGTMHHRKSEPILS